MFYLSDKVYIVNGAVNSAIYDLKKGELYHIGSEISNLIIKLTEHNKIDLTDTEIKYKKELIDLGIITEDCVKKHKIEELYENTEIQFAWIEITNMCNMKCIHCYEEADYQKGKIMSYVDFCHIIDELVLAKIKRIQIIGGEPFILGEKIFKYLEYCNDKFDYIEIFTNGTLIKDEWFAELKRRNIRIALSVYSYNESQHNKVTKNYESWKKTNNTIKKLNDYDINYRVKNVLMKGVDLGKRNTVLYELSAKRDIVRLTGRAKLDLLSDELIKNKLITEKNLVYRINENLVRKCVSGHNCFSRRLYFDVELNVFPCVMERRICHGTIKQKSLREVLKTDIFKMNKNYVEQCKICEFRYCCFDCRPDSNGNDVFSKPWYCTYYPEKGEWEGDIEKFIENLRNI